jgi:NAD(P)-dependent dehydrogenase (short-subunit alcohol dehydrogenase family)
MATLRPRGHIPYRYGCDRGHSGRADGVPDPENFATIDILVNNAGVDGAVLQHPTEDRWQPLA